MRPEVTIWLGHIREAARAIRRFTSETTFAKYAVDPMQQAAVERQFITIGEATRRLGQADPETVVQITEYPEIIGLRNYLVHEYEKVEAPEVWQIVQTGLPQLVSDVESLLRAERAE